MSKANGSQNGTENLNGNAFSISLPASSCALCSAGFTIQRDGQRHAANTEHEHASVEAGVLFEPGAGVLVLRHPLGLREEKLVAPCLYVVPAGLKHSTRWDTHSELFVAHVENDFWAEITGGVALDGTLPGVISAARNSLVFWELATLLRHIWDEGLPSQAQAIVAADALLRRAAGFFSAAPIPAEKLNGGLPPSPHHAMDAYIDRQLRFNLHTPDLAKIVGLSVTHFSTVLKHATGLTPHEYITRCRMLKAHQLLVTGDFCLGQVASAVGYDDPDHFSRIFRRFFNFPPRDLMIRSRGEPAKRPGKP